MNCTTSRSVLRQATESCQLPPCEDCLFLHALCANYQSAFWRNSLEKYPVIPNPVGNGWILEEDQLAVEWMRGRPAPEIVLVSGLQICQVL